MRPLLFRPPVCLIGLMSGLYGSTGCLFPSFFVSSEKVETDRNLVPGVVGLYFLIGIELDSLEQDYRQVRRDDRFFPVGSVAASAVFDLSASLFAFD